VGLEPDADLLSRHGLPPCGDCAPARPGPARRTAPARVRCCFVVVLPSDPRGRACRVRGPDSAQHRSLGMGRWMNPRARRAQPLRNGLPRPTATVVLTGHRVGRLRCFAAASAAPQRNLSSMPYRASIPKSGSMPGTDLLDDLRDPAGADGAATLTDGEAQ